MENQTETANISENLADLIISNAEPREVIDQITAVLTKKERTVSVETLPTDFMIPGSPGLAIERKEVSDLMNTWFDEDERLSNQLETLKMLESANYTPALLVVGNINEALSKRRGNAQKKQMHRSSITHLLMGVQLKWGIHVFRQEIPSLVPYDLNYLIGKVHGEKSAVPFRHTAAREMTPIQKATYLVQGLPGVGVKTADKIRGNTVSFMDFVTKICDEDFLKTADPKNEGVTFLTEKQKRAMYEVLEAGWRIQK